MLSTQQSFLAKSEDQGGGSGGGKSPILPFEFRDDENHSIRSDIERKDTKNKVNKDVSKKKKKRRK